MLPLFSLALLLGGSSNFTLVNATDADVAAALEAAKRDLAFVNETGQEEDIAAVEE